MALTYGFYNSVEGDRTYDAVQFGRIFDGLITDGIYANYEQGMAVMASENAGEVIIQPGRAWFNHTWSYNDANFVMKAPVPEVLLERIDALVLDIDTSLAARENKFTWVTGEPSSRPVNPTLIHTVTHNQYALCYVHRYPETTTIKAADITNVIGRETPVVAGVLNPIDVSAYIDQWDDEFHTWEDGTKADFTTWRNTVTAEFTAWQTGEKNAFEAWEAIQEASYNAWITAVKAQQVQDKADWDAWYADLQNQLHDLPEDTAEYLQIEIDDLKGNMSGSIFNISTTNPSLEGKTVTISNESGTDIVTSQFDENLSCIVKGYRSVGNITFSSTDGIQTASSTVDVPYFGNYSIPISFWAATIRIQGDEELAGYSVSIKDSNNILIGTVTLDNTGLAVTSVPKADTFTISTSYEGDTITDEIVVTQQVVYNATLSIWKATVNLVGDEDVANVVVTINNSDDLPVGTVTLNSSGNGVFYAKKADEYTFIWTIGGDTMEVSLNVTEETTYSVEIYAGFNWRTWCTLGGVSTYGKTSLSDVFANEEETRKLMTVHASADYLIDRVTHNVNDIDEFTVNDTAMKWIGLRDYVCDGLTAISGVWAKFLASDYWERILKDHVPKMTSNTAPYGTASTSAGAVSGYEPWRAFDRDISTFWRSSGTGTSSLGRIAYKFTNPINVRKIQHYHAFSATATYHIEYSDDGTTWTVVNNSSYSIPERTYVEKEIEDVGYHLYWATRFDSSEETTRAGAYILQFYGRSLNVSVPSMTSNTAPYGEVIASSFYNSTYQAYKAFNYENPLGNYSAWDPSGSDANPYIQYKFNDGFVLKKVFAAGNGNGAASKYYEGKVKISNNGNSFTDVSETAKVYFNNTWVEVPISEVTSPNKYVRFSCSSFMATSSGVQGAKFMFFGVDYSEREFAEGSTMKYLYDHGLELEPAITSTTGSSSVIEKRDSEIFASVTATKQTMAYALFAYDLTNYNLARIVIGDEFYAASASTDIDAILIFDSLPTYSYSSSAYLAPLQGDARLPYNCSLDSSSINGVKYIGDKCSNNTGATARKITFKELWLE